MKFLLDTNVISELRKGARCHQGVLRWSQSTVPQAQHTSVLVIGEMRRGVEMKRRSDPPQADILEKWLLRTFQNFDSRILPVDAPVAEAWGRLGARGSIPDIDGLLAATAVVHDLTLVTADQVLLGIKGVNSINPFLTP